MADVKIRQSVVLRRLFYESTGSRVFGVPLKGRICADRPHENSCYRNPRR